jgi:hypothetical protein
MGYDVYSVDADAQKSASFAKKWKYEWLFDKESQEFKGDSRVYFRANIWGMSRIRDVVQKIANSQGRDVDDFLRKFSWNDGEHVTVDECLDVAAMIDSCPEPVLKEFYLEHVQDPSSKEELGYALAEIKEFSDYLKTSAELGGCEVY